MGDPFGAVLTVAFLIISTVIIHRMLTLISYSVTVVYARVTVQHCSCDREAFSIR